MYPPRGQPGEAPVRLALAMLLLFTEELTDREYVFTPPPPGYDIVAAVIRNTPSYVMVARKAPMFHGY